MSCATRPCACKSHSPPAGSDRFAHRFWPNPTSGYRIFASRRGTYFQQASELGHRGAESGALQHVEHAEDGGQRFDAPLLRLRLAGRPRLLLKQLLSQHVANTFEAPADAFALE